MARGAFHHALIIPATFLNEHSKAENTSTKIRREALYDSENLARHMANYVMSQIPTLSITHISSSDIIASDIWSDPFRVYACLFAKASRVLFLVTQHDVVTFGAFTRGHLQSLLNQSTPKDYDWKSRFLVLAMGDFELPAALPCEVIRFREVGWFRDSMALFVLGKKIQEFWNPKLESSCLFSSPEKLKFATNLEETETFQTSLIVKTLNDEGSAEKHREIHGNFNSTLDHEALMISSQCPGCLTHQNFDVRFDIASNRSLEIHELLLPDISTTDLSGINQLSRKNECYYTVQSDIGCMVSSSDMDDNSPVLDDVHSMGDSVGEMQWSSPDSVSVVQEVNHVLPPDESALTLVAMETEELRNKPPHKNGKVKTFADAEKESEPPKPAKRIRTTNDQVTSRSCTFFNHEKDALSSLREGEIHPPIIVETSTEETLEATAERSMEIETSLCPMESCNPLMKSMLSAQKSEDLPCSDELETTPTTSKRASTSEHLTVAKENTIASSDLIGDKKCAYLMEPQCFPEQDELSTITSSTEIKMKHPNAFTLSPSSLHPIIEGSGGRSRVNGHEDEIPGEMASNSVLSASSDDRSSQTRWVKWDDDSFHSIKEESLCPGKGKKVSKNESIEKRRSMTSNAHCEGIRDRRSQSYAEGFKVKEKGKFCNLNGDVEKSHLKSQSTEEKKSTGQENINFECHSTDSRTDQVTTTADIGDEHLSDAFIEKKKPRFNDMLGSSFKPNHCIKRRSLSLESMDILQKHGIEKCLSKKQSSSEPHLNLVINKTRNPIPNPYVVFPIRSGNSLEGGVEHAIVGNFKTLGSAEIRQVMGEGILLENTYSLINTKTASLSVGHESPDEKLKDSDEEGSSQVDMDEDLKTPNISKTGQISPSLSPIKIAQKGDVVSTSNSTTAKGSKNDYDVTTTSTSVPVDNVFCSFNDDASCKGHYFTLKTVEGKFPDLKNVFEKELRERQRRTQETFHSFQPTNSTSSTKTMERDPYSETRGELNENKDAKPKKLDSTHLENVPDIVSDEHREHRTPPSMDIRDTTGKNAKGCINDYPFEDLAKSMSAPKKVKASMPAYSSASKEQSTLVICESSLEQTTDVLKPRGRRRNGTQIIDVLGKSIRNKHLEFKSEKFGEIALVSINAMGSHPESLQGSMQKDEKLKVRPRKSLLNQDSADTDVLRNNNEGSTGQLSPTKGPNNIRFEDTSYGVECSSQDLLMYSPKCRSRTPDSDCDPEITSSTMSRPSCLLSTDKFSSSIPLPKVVPRAKIAQTNCLESSAFRNGLKSDKLNDESLPFCYLTSGVGTMKSEAMGRRPRSEEHKLEIEKRFSSISINDEVNQQEFEVANTAIGSAYSGIKISRRPSASSTRLLHETGEYQRNLSTQVQLGGRRHEIQVHGPYFRLIEENIETDKGPSTYWCDRSVGSPTPCGLSTGFDTTSNSSMVSENSRISSDGKSL
ncbi:unnamed protein product [Hydatigera taeniaeformis]|uniref:Uncharacterized protein n=1 Tax=Hydatigena taeniaeformis TaxID=6205 RepID=A0A0R3X3J5_HYDTA|nr:unnamed protein product [Hydatigera taeniaeformis]